eukprot:TRINITY_DN73980_c0_g1_i1.p1 TRINITY_DN73980_c0_g1~~TRINITY_DN73980_c0_g1_i1.p1  ORF type:complete len:138 (+),score=35.03 TRINITY_DN73980_c0_g1_i1:65-478(+)
MMLTQVLVFLCIKSTLAEKNDPTKGSLSHENDHLNGLHSADLALFEHDDPQFTHGKVATQSDSSEVTSELRWQEEEDLFLKDVWTDGDSSEEDSGTRRPSLVWFLGFSAFFLYAFVAHRKSHQGSAPTTDACHARVS